MITTHLVVLSFLDGATGSTASAAGTDFEGFVSTPPYYLFDGFSEAAATDTTNTGGWLSPEQVKQLRKIERRAQRAQRKEFKRLIDKEAGWKASLRDAYEQAYQPWLAEERARKLDKAVRPYAKAQTPAPLTPAELIDFDGLMRSREAVALLARTLREIAAEQEEEEVAVMMMALVQ